MEYTLRPYQVEAVNAAVRFFKSDARYNAIEVLPTGAGKSIIIANIIKELGEKTLVFQPSKEILEQNLAKYLSYGYQASVYSASAGQKKVSNTTFATIGSVVNKSEMFNEFKYIIIDECHLVNAKGGMYDKFLSEQSHIKVLGLTATPYRLSSDSFGGAILKFLTRTRPRIFTKMIYYVNNAPLFEAGFLAKMKYYPVGEFDIKKLQVNTTGADYTEKSVRSYYESIGFPDMVVRSVKRLLEIRKNVLVFTMFVDESEYLVKNIPEAVIVTAQTPKKEREQILADYKAGKIKCICNVGILTLGFDYPELETVVLARPTMSLALYYQMIGRCIRPHPGKESAWVVDLCGNIELFGHIETLHIGNSGNDKYYVANNKRQLTNKYYNSEGEAANPYAKKGIFS